MDSMAKRLVGAGDRLGHRGNILCGWLAGRIKTGESESAFVVHGVGGS